MDDKWIPDWYPNSEYAEERDYGDGPFRLMTSGAAFAWDYSLEFLAVDRSIWSDEPTESLYFAFLPSRLRQFYDQEFLDRFWVEIQRVHELVKCPPSLPLLLETPAQELALSVLSQTAESVVEIDQDSGAFGLTDEDLESVRFSYDILVEDADVDMFYSYAFDGFERDEASMTFLRYKGEPLAFENWFKPYRP